MEKLNPTEFSRVLGDVRTSYRLLALYQDRLVDIVKYIGNTYGMNFNSGWAKFSKANSNGSRARIDAWGWDWLPLYLYEFHMGKREFGEDLFSFKIVHQADTGHPDINSKEQLNKQDVENFGRSESSRTRLFLILSKNEWGCPIHHILDSNLDSASGNVIVKGNWIAVPYDLTRFIDQESTDLVLREFNQIVNSHFQIELIEKVLETMK